MLSNQLLVAMPSADDPLFSKVVVYVCEHSENGAIGLIINRPTDYNLSFVFEQLDISSCLKEISEKPVLFGGPVQQDRGFVLHRPFAGFEANLEVSEEVSISTSQDILRTLADGQGPDDVLVTLGYAGWAANQLEEEICQNLWLNCPATSGILYNTPFDDMWQVAIESIGFDMNKLSMLSGNA